MSTESVPLGTVRPRPPAARISRQDWGVLALTMAFWAFDGYETSALVVTGVASLHQLLPAADAGSAIRFFGYLLAITLAGWTIGGILGGFVGDRIGRRRTMIYSVLVYAVFTGLSALSTTWVMLAATRFLTGLGIGAEWAVGTSLIQEVWPERYRTRGAGILQSAYAVGGLAAAGLWILFSHENISWRYIYLAGILPAIVVLLVARAIPESVSWVQHKVGSTRELFKNLSSPRLRRHLGLSLLVSLAITLGWWAGSSYLPSYVGALASPADRGFYTGLTLALYDFGQLVGCIAFGFLAEAVGRRVVGFVYILGSLVMTGVIFLIVDNVLLAALLQLIFGYMAGGVYSWYTVHPPELFPTRIRSSAIGLVFNGARIPAVVGAFLTGTLAASLGGVGHAAFYLGLVYVVGLVAIFFLPETKGQPLPT